MVIVLPARLPFVGQLAEVWVAPIAQLVAAPPGHIVYEAAYLVLFATVVSIGLPVAFEPVEPVVSALVAHLVLGDVEPADPVVFELVVH